MKTLIIAAGEGTRLRPFTFTRPKPMIPILGKPMLEYVIEQLKRLGSLEIIMVVGYRRSQIQQFFGDGEQLGVAIKYLVQEQQTGEADAILLAESELRAEEHFFMVDSDFFADDGMLENTWKTAKQDNSDISLALTHVDNPSQFGIVEIDSSHKVHKIIEKPAPGTEPSTLGVSSIYVFSPRIFSVLRKTHDLEKAIQNLIDTRNSVIGAPWKGTWMDVGRPWDLLKATDYLLDKTLKNGSQIDDTVKIHKDAEVIEPVIIGSHVTILKGAVIRGPVFIGDNCMIGNNSLIRNGTSLGSQVEVGFSNEVTHSVIFNSAAISHFVYCGDSVIGERSHLGAGTTTANVRFDGKPISVNLKQTQYITDLTKLGVIMGDQSHTGVNVSIYPGRVIGANCWIGPGVTVREDVPSNYLVQNKGVQRLEQTKRPPLTEDLGS